MEDDPGQLDRLRPLNMYGCSKHLFDLHARRAGFLDRVVGLKYFNVFGPNEDHKGDMRSLVHKSFGQVRDTGAIRLFKSYRPDYRDGEQKRDFLYVKDAVAMTLHLAATPRANGLFNIGSGQARTWLDLANAVFAALQRKPNIQFVEMPAEIRDKYQYFTQANLARLRAAGYAAPVTPLDLKALTINDPEPAGGGLVRQKITLQDGVPMEKAKEIVRLIKDSKLKVQASIQEKQVRVVGKSRDDLQSVIALLKGKDLGIALQFTNYRSS